MRLIGIYFLFLNVVQFVSGRQGCQPQEYFWNYKSGRQGRQSQEKNNYVRIRQSIQTNKENRYK